METITGSDVMQSVTRHLCKLRMPRKRVQANGGSLEVHLGTYQQAVVDFMFGAKHALASTRIKKDGR